MILFILLLHLINSEFLNKSCLTNYDCDDKIWCNGKEYCHNKSCVNDATPCHILINKAKEFNLIYSLDNIQILCYETMKQCISKFYCYSNEDCDDNIFCNGKEYCNKESHLCMKSSINDLHSLCLKDEICDFKIDHCISTINIKSKISISIDNSNDNRDIIISLISFLVITIIFTIIFLFIISKFLWEKGFKPQKIISI